MEQLTISMQVVVLDKDDYETICAILNDIETDIAADETADSYMRRKILSNIERIQKLLKEDE